MLGELSRVPDDELLTFVQLILAREGVMTERDHTELAQIDAEFKRREQLSRQRNERQGAV